MAKIKKSSSIHHGIRKSSLFIHNGKKTNNHNQFIMAKNSSLFIHNGKITNNHHRVIMPKKSSLFIHNGKKQIIIIDSSWQRSCLPMAISWDKNKNKELNKK